MNGGDNSVQAGMISALTLVTLNYGIGYATYRSKRLEALIEGRPQLLIHNGKLYRDVMEKQRLTQHELDAALRRQGVSDIAHVHVALLENNAGHHEIALRQFNAMRMVGPAPAYGYWSAVAYALTELGRDAELG